MNPPKDQKFLPQIIEMSEPLIFLCSFPVNFADKNGGGGCEMSTSERGVCVCEKKRKGKKKV